jgi:hypothetical protein
MLRSTMFDCPDPVSTLEPSLRWRTQASDCRRSTLYGHGKVAVSAAPVTLTASPSPGLEHPGDRTLGDDGADLRLWDGDRSGGT